MKKFSVSIILLFILVAPALSVDLSKPYIPTRVEWLELRLHNLQCDLTPQLHYEFSSPYDKIVVEFRYHASANLSSSEVNDRMNVLRLLTEDILNDYPWSKGISIESRLEELP